VTSLSELLTKHRSVIDCYLSPALLASHCSKKVEARARGSTSLIGTLWPREFISYVPQVQNQQAVATNYEMVTVV
jgi:hypothetical protein